MTISEQLRAAVRDAEKRGITQYRIAKDSGINPSVVLRFVAGGGLQLPTVDVLCETLNLELQPIRKPGG